MEFLAVSSFLNCPLYHREQTGITELVVEQREGSSFLLSFFSTLLPQFKENKNRAQLPQMLPGSDSAHAPERCCACMVTRLTDISLIHSPLQTHTHTLKHTLLHAHTHTTGIQPFPIILCAGFDSLSH